MCKTSDDFNQNMDKINTSRDEIKISYFLQCTKPYISRIKRQ